MPVKVSLVEDNDRVRESLASLIDGARGFRCVGAHRSAEAALRLVPEEEPDVVLMDIHLPRLSGIDCVRKLKAIELEILDLLARGYMNKEIADALSIAFQTVHTHVRNIYSKLHVRSRTEAVAKYLRPQ